MPVYHYKCKTCEMTIVMMANINDRHESPTCIKCNARMVRDYGLGTITFKGSGFYRTDK